MPDLLTDTAAFPLRSWPPRAGLYRTILADPPWKEQGAGKIKRGADRHYPLMTTDAIASIPVSEWAAPNAHAYVWVTNNFLPDGLRVLAAWGFRYVTKIDWFKGEFADLDDEWALWRIQQTLMRERGDAERTAGGAKSDDGTLMTRAVDLLDELRAIPGDDLQIGLGQYFRGATESCLFGVRGDCAYRFGPDGKRAQGKTGFLASRGQHSAKPEDLHRMAERVSTGPRLEMFARRAVPNWDAWGNETFVPVLPLTEVEP